MLEAIRSRFGATTRKCRPPVTSSQFFRKQRTHSTHLPEAGLASARQSAIRPDSLWKVRAPILTYLDDEGKAHLEGGVQADSSEGSLESQSLDVFFSAPASLSPRRVLTSPERRPNQVPQLDAN